MGLVAGSSYCTPPHWQEAAPLAILTPVHHVSAVEKLVSGTSKGTHVCILHTHIIHVYLPTYLPAYPTCVHTYVRTYIHTSIHPYIHACPYLALPYITLLYIALHCMHCITSHSITTTIYHLPLTIAMHKHICIYTYRYAYTRIANLRGRCIIFEASNIGALCSILFSLAKLAHSKEIMRKMRKNLLTFESLPQWMCSNI